MKVDAIFWIASMTKPVTGTAVMMMQDAGKLSVDDPVSKYLPEFKDLKDSTGKQVVVTLKHCLTHSAGLSRQRARVRQPHDLKDLMPLVVAKPVQFAPGSKWQYCQTASTPPPASSRWSPARTSPPFSTSAVRPLGMKDTTFYPTAAQAERIAASYARTDDGKLEKTGLMFLATRRSPAANATRGPTAGCSPRRATTRGSPA